MSLIYAIVHNVVAILGLPILAVVLLFIPRGSETLPKAFRWWDNGEMYYKANDEPDGLMGPDYYREARGTLDKESISYWTIYKERFIWLALRNPADYFKYTLGFTVKDKLTVLEDNGNVAVGDHEGDPSGTYKLVVKNGDHKEYWEWYTVWQYPFTDWIFRLRWGWKIRDPHDDIDGKTIPYEFSITPIKKRR